MANKITKMIIKIIIISLIFQIVNMSVVKAGDWSEIFSTGNNFIEEGKIETQKNQVIDGAEVKNLNSDIYNILLALGIVLSVIIGGILGIQLMWGSIEQQVKAKEMLMPYAVGCVVIFGAFGIWKICVTIFSQI